MKDSGDNVDRELFRNMQKLRALRIEHRDLDEVIARLSLDIHIDELQLKRLKKRKLVLKDQILLLESQLIPGPERLRGLPLQEFLTYLTSPRLLAQLLGIAVVVFIAWLAGRAARSAWQRRAAGRPAWQAAAAGRPGAAGAGAGAPWCCCWSARIYAERRARHRRPRRWRCSWRMVLVLVRGGVYRSRPAARPALLAAQLGAAADAGRLAGDRVPPGRLVQRHPGGAGRHRPAAGQVRTSRSGRCSRAWWWSPASCWRAAWSRAPSSSAS